MKRHDDESEDVGLHRGVFCPKLGPEDYANWRKSSLGNLTEQIERDAVLRLAGRLRSKRVLEVGCGDGAYSIAASVRGAQVAAMDISAPMLSSARRLAEESGAIVGFCWDGPAARES